MVGPQPRLHLPFAQWPAQDRARWASAIADDDPFSDAPGARLAKTTLHARWMAWRRFLGFLAVTEPEALQIPLTERLTIGRVRQLAKHLGKTNAPHTVACQIDTLYGAARILLPENDWGWLREIKARLYTAAPSRGRSGPVITSVQLLDLGLELMAECAIEPGKTVSMADAVRYRDGFMIALIAFMAPRHKNLAAMEIGRHLFQEGENWFVVVPPEETKTGAPIDFQVPDVIRSHLAVYLDRIRPRLLRRAGCKALWVSAKGGALSYSAVGPVVTRHTTERLGVRITLHDARDAAATTWAIAAPEQILVARDLLTHADLRMTNKHYNRAKGIEASRAQAQLIARIRSRRNWASRLSRK